MQYSLGLERSDGARQAGGAAYKIASGFYGRIKTAVLPLYNASFQKILQDVVVFCFMFPAKV